MLIVRNLSVAHGNVTAVDGVSFEVNQGEIVALIGANGAGKSSTLMAISGVVRARSGEIMFQGQDIAHASSHAIVARGLVQVPEGRMIFAGLTVGENLSVGGYTYRGGDSEQRLGDVLSLFPVLKDRLSEPASNLSGGQLQMLALARGWMANPKLLVLDEPSLGLAPLAVRDVLALVAAMKRRGVTILLVEQNVRQALQIADRAYVLEAGRIALEGPSQQLLEDDRLISTYLGRSAS